MGPQVAQVVCHCIVHSQEIGCCELDVGRLAQLVDCAHNIVHWRAPSSHMVEVSHGHNVVAAYLHCLALEEWKEGLEGVVYCGYFEHVDVALFAWRPPAC